MIRPANESDIPFLARVYVATWQAAYRHILPDADGLPNEVIYNIKVYGTDVDAQTRCRHYHRDIDIIAIKFKCCEKWFSCFDCHAEFSAHQPQVWSLAEYDNPAVLCGGCGRQLTITEYLKCDSVCPNCRRAFNPGCARHYHLYFEV